MPVRVIGGGPAGSCAALRALACGESVEVFEKSPFPRHKVCGEFLSPEAAHVLDTLGAWRPIQDVAPALIRRVRLHLGKRLKTWRLPEPAYGISRFALDDRLRRHAIDRGAAWIRHIAPLDLTPAVIACGRRMADRRGRRLFGFKAHFSGVTDDAVDLYFFRGCYLGVSAVEGGAINVCGIAPESHLREFAFDLDAFLSQQPMVAARLGPLTRTMPWLTTGPLLFTSELPSEGATQYLCGDALGFIDPFTGSGMLSAMVTGKLAGEAAARGLPASEHLATCRRVLWAQYRFSALARKAIETGVAGLAAACIPGNFLFRLTRPTFV